MVNVIIVLVILFVIVIMGIQDYIVGFFKQARINITAEQAMKCYFA